MSGGCAFVVELSDQFGHGARPDLARSPIDCFHAIYSELSSFRMRRVDPFECLTISLGFVHSGDQYNVIPGTSPLAVRPVSSAMKSGIPF